MLHDEVHSGKVLVLLWYALSAVSDLMKNSMDSLKSAEDAPISPPSLQGDKERIVRSLLAQHGRKYIKYMQERIENNESISTNMFYTLVARLSTANSLKEMLEEKSKEKETDGFEAKKCIDKLYVCAYRYAEALIVYSALAKGRCLPHMKMDFQNERLFQKVEKQNRVFAAKCLLEMKEWGCTPQPQPEEFSSVQELEKTNPFCAIPYKANSSLHTVLAHNSQEAVDKLTQILFSREMYFILFYYKDILVKQKFAAKKAKKNTSSQPKKVVLPPIEKQPDVEANPSEKEEEAPSLAVFSLPKTDKDKEESEHMPNEEPEEEASKDGEPTLRSSLSEKEADLLEAPGKETPEKDKKDKTKKKRWTIQNLFSSAKKKTPSVSSKHHSLESVLVGEGDSDVISLPGSSLPDKAHDANPSAENTEANPVKPKNFINSTKLLEMAKASSAESIVSGYTEESLASGRDYYTGEEKRLLQSGSAMSLGVPPSRAQSLDRIPIITSSIRKGES
ncbi:hypothetical protein NECID01_0982 [Nematocida sp. AWRm77]|nr:hypothetical protein NECID01_0982 [Nematocida sp. AWRm77]